MKNPFQRKYLISTLTGIVLLLILKTVSGQSQFLYYFFINFLFFFFLGIISHFLFLRGMQRGGRASLGGVLISFTIKFLMGASLVLIWSRYETLDKIPFFFAFALAYILFVIPEIWGAIEISESKKKR